MRYEVYGIYDSSGINYGPITVEKSMKAAIQSAKANVSLNCTFWAVLVKAGRHSYPYEIIAGLRGQNPTRATMLVMPNPQYGNPITSPTDAAKFWAMGR